MWNQGSWKLYKGQQKCSQKILRRTETQWLYVCFSMLYAVINMSRCPGYLRKGQKGCGQNSSHGHTHISGWSRHTVFLNTTWSRSLDLRLITPEKDTSVYSGLTDQTIKQDFQLSLRKFYTFSLVTAVFLDFEHTILETIQHFLLHKPQTSRSLYSLLSESNFGLRWRTKLKTD